MANEKPATVKRLMEDLSALPENAEVFVSVLGAGITIPIIGLAKFTTTEGMDIIVLTIPAHNTAKALEIYQENMLKNMEAGVAN